MTQAKTNIDLSKTSKLTLDNENDLFKKSKV